MSRAPAATHTLRVLTHLAGKVEPVPAAAIAHALDLPRSTTYRLLTEMASLGYATHYRDEGTWGLGVAAFTVPALARFNPQELKDMNLIDAKEARA